MNIPFVSSFSAIDFAAVRYENLIQDLNTAISNAKIEIDLICQNLQEPTFENTVEALEKVGQEIDLISSLIFNLNHAHTNPTILEAAKQAAPLLSEYSNDILLNEKLFLRVENVFFQNPLLDTESKTLLQKTYLSFLRNGSKLNKVEKEKLRQIDSRLSELSVLFGENVINETKNYELYVENEHDVSGIPERVLNEAAKLCQSKGKKGWCFTLFAPSYIPFITYCPNRELRKEIFLAYGSRALNSNPQVLKEIVSLRSQRVKLLGYATYAEFVLEERMAQTAQNVIGFLDELKEAAQPYAQSELAQMQKLALEHGIDHLQHWDWAYFSEKLKEQKLSFNQEELREYFLLENTLNGIFKICNILFSLEFVASPQIAGYHPDVVAYEVWRNGKAMGLLYLDLFARESKSPGAWKTNFRQPKVGTLPLVSIVCNFTTSKPALLSFEEVWTLFHEFGHALHVLLSECRYGSLSGTHVLWDFVELPSQLFENWCVEPESLALFAKHYQSGEPMDTSIIQKLKAMSLFQEGYATLRQLAFAYLDMACHSRDSLPDDVEQFEKQITASLQLLPSVAGIAVLPSFSHIFNGGYAAGYYSYKWAEVLEANAYAYFKEHGFLNPQAGEHLRLTILSKGGSDKPGLLFENFLGHPPKVKALIEKLFSEKL